MRTNSMTIHTDYVCPPIPVRDFDWRAVFDDYDGAPDASSPMGHGATEFEAIKDLIEQAEGRLS